VLVLSSDNGASSWHEFAGGNNAPLRGNKKELFEGGVRVFSLVVGRHEALINSAVVGGTYSKGFIQLIDWHTTLAALGGYVDADEAELEVNSGRDVWAALTGDLPSPRREMLISTDYDDAFGVAYRHADWKLLVRTPYGPALTRSPADTYADDDEEVVQVSGRHFGWWWPSRSGNNTLYLQRQAELAAAGPTNRRKFEGVLLFNIVCTASSHAVCSGPLSKGRSLARAFVRLPPSPDVEHTSPLGTGGRPTRATRPRCLGGVQGQSARYDETPRRAVAERQAL